jgi:hypothetical protein
MQQGRLGSDYACQISLRRQEPLGTLYTVSQLQLYPLSRRSRVNSESWKGPSKLGLENKLPRLVNEVGLVQSAQVLTCVNKWFCIGQKKQVQPIATKGGRVPVEGVLEVT